MATEEPPPRGRAPIKTSHPRSQAPLAAPSSKKGNLPCVAAVRGFRACLTPDPSLRGRTQTGSALAPAGTHGSAPTNRPPAAGSGREVIMAHGGWGCLDQGHRKRGAAWEERSLPSETLSLRSSLCGTLSLKSNWKLIFFYSVVLTFQGSHFRIWLISPASPPPDTPPPLRALAEGWQCVLAGPQVPCGQCPGGPSWRAPAALSTQA